MQVSLPLAEDMKLHLCMRARAWELYAGRAPRSGCACCASCASWPSRCDCDALGRRGCICVCRDALVRPCGAACSRLPPVPRCPHGHCSCTHDQQRRRCAQERLSEAADNQTRWRARCCRQALFHNRVQRTLGRWPAGALSLSLSQTHSLARSLAHSPAASFCRTCTSGSCSAWSSIS